MPPLPTSGPGSAKAKAVAAKFKASGPGRPAPIKKQPLPAYGPYKLPLTAVEKRIVISKRTPKFVDTPRGRIATGGGGVGFFTKGDKTPIMARVTQRALARQSGIENTAAARVLAAKSAPKPVDKVAARPNESGLKGFYDEHILPVVGQAFSDLYNTTKETYGTNIILAPVVQPVVYGSKAVDKVASAVGVDAGAEKNVASAFDAYAHDVVAGAYGIAKTKGWDNARPYVVPAVDKAVKIVKASGSAGQNAIENSAQWSDKELAKTVVYDWAKKNAAAPTKDFVANTYDRLFNSGLSKRIASAPAIDREKIYLSNDMANRDPNAVSAASPADRERWIKLATGQSNNPLWKGYDSGFSVAELQKMSDYELVNAAYGSHSNIMQRVWGAAQNDLKKIGAIPAAVQQLDNVINESQKKGDYRGLGYMAEYLATQAGYNIWALHEAGVYAGTAGLQGDYKPLVRALQAEPILTTLDVAATATVYGKAATAALKTGGALTKVGSAAGRIPGAVRIGSRIATAAERGAYRTEQAVSGIGPEARVPTTLGGPLRAAAAAGRGARKIADTQVVVAENPVFAKIRESTPGAQRTPSEGAVYLPSESFFSKSRAVLRKKLYEQDNAVGQVIRDVTRKMDAAKERALISHVANVMGSQRAQVYVAAFQRLVKQDPVVAQRALFDLQGLDMLDIPESLVGALGVAGDGGKLVIGPAEELARLQHVMDGGLWVRRGTADAADEFRYVTPQMTEADIAAMGDSGFKQVLTSESVRTQGITDTSRIEILDANKTARLQENMDNLRRIAEADPVKVKQAKDFLSVAIDGARRGRGETKSSINDFATADELQNIADLGALGKTPNAGVADMPANLGADLGIPVAAGASRRTEGLSGLARVQDPTIARLLAAPIAGVLRAKVESILAGAAERTTAKSGRLAEVSANASRNANDAAEALRIAESDLAAVEAELAKARAATPKTVKAKAAQKTTIKSLSSKASARRRKVAILNAKSERLGKVGENVATRADVARAEADTIIEAQSKIDAYVESALRDLIEAGDIPGGGKVFFPTETTSAGPAMSYDPARALAGRAGTRDLLDVHTAQMALVGSADDIAKFGSVLARNLRLPGMALQIVTRLNNYLTRTGVVIRMAGDEAAFSRQVDSIAALQRIYGGTKDDFRIIAVDENTGFLGDRVLGDLQAESIDKTAAKGVEGIQIDDARLGQIVSDALETNARDSFDFQTHGGRRIVIIETSRLKKLQEEITRAAQAPTFLEKLSRKWVRITLNTLPRTAFNNIVGSAVLAGLGGTGLRGFVDAYRLMKTGDIPAEISRVGMAGLVDTPFAARLGENGLWARTGQRYMDTLQAGNVVGEDFSRMAVFAGSVRKSLKNNPALAAQLEKDLAEAGKVNAAFEDLLAYVARGEYRDAKLVSPEAIAVRDKAISSANDFLGSQSGLTSITRFITKIIPFYHWYAHIIKLYFWTMPLNYPGRTLFLNTMARIAGDQQRESGLMDSFYSDAIRVGTEMVGDNQYAVGLRSGVGPFSGFGGIGGAESSAPLVDYIYSSTTPLITAPATALGLTGDFRPMLNASGERIPNILAPGGIEAATAQLERAIAPLGLIQRTLSPSGSVLFSAAQGFPEVQQRRPGAGYAITPKGVPGLGGLRGLGEAALGGLAGISVIRTPVAGPVKIRQIKGREKSKLQDLKDAAKKEQKANKK